MSIELLSYSDLLEMDRGVVLYVHWSGVDYTPYRDESDSYTSVGEIIDDVAGGEYTAEYFDEYSYCCTLEEYKRYQAENQD